MKTKQQVIEAVVDRNKKYGLHYKEEWLKVVETIIDKITARVGNDVMYDVYQDWDPESGSFNDSIWLEIKTYLSPEEAIELLDEIDEDVLIQQDDDFRAWFLYDITFLKEN